MDIKQIAKDTTKTLVSYLTYQALKTVLAQLDETDPKRAYWLHQFSSREKIQDVAEILRDPEIPSFEFHQDRRSAGE